MSFLKILNTALDAVSRTNRYIDFMTTLSPMLAGQGQSPVKDPAGSLVAHQHDLSSANRLEFGEIVDAIPNTNVYRVQPEAGGPTTDCTLGMRGASTPVGTWDGSSLPVGTHVWYIRSKSTMAGGIILCSSPMYMTDPREYFGDIISQGSNTGLHVESGFDGPMGLGGTQGPMKLYGGITDWSGRGPFDSMDMGEFNKSTETGIMTHMDPYMTFTRVNEWSGLWMFYWDGLVRLGAQNYVQMTGCCEHESKDDEGEHFWYYGTAVYPWENLGQLKSYSSSWVKENTVNEVQEDYPWYARREPSEDDIQTFHRLKEYRGYVGQGQSTWMTSYAPSDVSLLEYGDTDYQFVGLHQDSISLAGHRHMRGALGTTIAKRACMPVPKRLKVVEDEEGDKSPTYRASGESSWGSPAHKVQPTPDPYNTVNDEQHAMHKISAVMDLHAHMFNWESTHPFHYHTKDYYYPEESDYSHVTTNQETIDWGELTDEYQWYLDTPSATEIQIDHREGMTADIYPNYSYFSLLDEGGVVIGDGFGSEIRMASGCVWITAPGDVFLEAGRNVIGWGGRDVCLRAKDHVDVSANDGDVRIKAEFNMQLIQNNTGLGGIFLDCRAEGPDRYDFDKVGVDAIHTGIILKCPHTEMITWAKNIYLRTGIPSGKHDGVSGGGGDQPKKGDIVLDTDAKADVITRSIFMKHFVKCAVVDIFRDKGGRAVNFFTEEGATMCGDVYNDGDHVSFGSVLTKKDFLSAEGHFFSPSGGYVGELSDKSAGTVSDAIQQGHSHEMALIKWSVKRYNIDFKRMWYSAKRPGNEDIMKSAWPSMRTESDYGTQSYFHWETRWQQMYRTDGGSTTLDTWTERSVETNKDGDPDTEITDTMPFPGWNKLEDEDDIYYRQALSLYSHSSGESAARGVNYESTVELDPFSKVKMNGNYRVAADPPPP